MTTLFCLPFAGGNLSSFFFLKPYLPSHLRLEVLEYPGHGRRIKIPPLESLDEITEDLFVQLRSRVQGKYLLYGHSMGACLTYLLAERIYTSATTGPKHLVLSGHGPPGLRPKQPRHLLPRSDFLALIARVQGTPAEVLACQELLDFMEPVLRADFKAMDTYLRPALPPLPYPMAVLHGQDDPFTTRDEALSWQKLAGNTFTFEELSGGHFFIHDHPTRIAQVFAEISP